MPTKKKRTNPFRGVLDMMSEMNRISDTMSNLETSSATATPRGFSDAWSPPTDIFARGEDLYIRCELAGVYSEDVEVSFSHGLLTIAGERKRDDTDVIYYASERYLGNFRREITLPEGTADEDISADFDDGLLTVRVAGAANAEGPSRIQVNSKKKPR
ncbi:Hsp20/alpha crystallin family protein [Streptomonospora wellingtoniae]|uniref:Hsp20/alpha crystallin family protein n=1 Tax=Streptomonospora wellingtoniae TaxID=3075544 RepID=A0ABU2KQA4_9ACTN|nr:Hsp20/alpha crystallin family protein [Streptomonospora sp. DSM 45055]MDT0301449.1 Hsp20/alpha crystallin family protein [Streptomonospora sp. DSM 45055]